MLFYIYGYYFSYFYVYLYIQYYRINYIHIYLVIKVYVSLHDCLSMEKYVDIKKYAIGKLLLIYL